MKIFFFCVIIIAMPACSLIQVGGYNPPSKNEALSNSLYNWQRDSTSHFNYYYELNSICANYVDSTKIYMEKGYPELLEFLGVKNYRSKLNLFMVDSRERMKKIIGMETNGIAKVEDNTVYSVFSPTIRIYGKHEFCHVITCNEWGMYKEIWLSEGLAVNSDNKWWGYDLHSLANYLKVKGKLIPMNEIVENFHKYESFITYPECGSFVKYVKEKYGLDIIKELWKAGRIGFENKLGKNISEIEKYWIQEINKYDYAKIDYEEKVFAMFGQKL
ncbi:MAG: hypothetical protein NTZ27_03220 [Ignavibacteriales bacterium]|nr:hypothetical protein [Ignavibacteriales bacterium]